MHTLSVPSLLLHFTLLCVVLSSTPCLPRHARWRNKTVLCRNLTSNLFYEFCFFETILSDLSLNFRVTRIFRIMVLRVMIDDL